MPIRPAFRVSVLVLLLALPRDGALPRLLPIVTNAVNEAVGDDYDILGRGCLDP